MVVSVQSVHDGGLNWYYATADGSLYMAEGPTESKWITGPIGIQAGPAVKEGIRKVWVGTAGGELITADALHGTVLRTASLGDGVFYLGCHGPNLIAQLENGTIIALDPQTETVRWTTGVNGQVLSAVETQDVLLLLLFSGPAAVALDANSGAVLWQTPYEGGQASADNGTFYITNYHGLFEARSAAGAVRWQKTNPSVNYSAVNTYQGALYVVDESQSLYSLAEADGSVTWTAQLPGYAYTPLYSPAGPALIIPFSNTGEPPSPGLSCYDPATGAKRDWVLGADLKSAFDRIDHEFLMKRLGTFPAREQIRGWLKAGVVDKGRYSPTDEGTHQGGVISPLLLNIALQGMEEAAGVRYDSRGYVQAGCPTVIVYADDFVALCHSREQAETVQAKLSTWLKDRGLTLNREKTRIGRISDGFDFLSFNIRRYHTSGGSKVLTRPSRDAMKKIRRRLADELRALRGGPVIEVISTLNPIIRGQANYYRTGASKKSYQVLDSYLWQKLFRWACREHPKKGRKWVTARYFGQYNPHRRNQWVFGDRETGAYLHQYAWTNDPALARYWADRRRKRKPPQLAPSWHRALRDQHGLCPLCGEPLLYTDDATPDSLSQWETWYAAVRKAMTRQAITEDSTGRTKHRLVHAYCARRHPDGAQHGTDQHEADA